LTVYDLSGKEVTVLVDGIEAGGYKSVTWDASAVSSGVYFCRLEAISTRDQSERFLGVRKMILLK